MVSSPGIEPPEGQKQNRKEPGVPAPQLATCSLAPMPTIHGHLPEGALMKATRPHKQGHTTENASQ